MDIEQLTTNALNVFAALEPSADNEYTYIQFSHRPFMKLKLSAHVDRIEKIVKGFPAGVTVLDLGAGTGLLEWTAKQLGADLNIKSFTRVQDINNPYSRYSDAAKGLGVELGFYEGDIFSDKIDLGIGTVDVVVFTHVLGPQTQAVPSARPLELNIELANNITSSDFWGSDTKLVSDRSMNNDTLVKYGKRILT